MRTYLKEEGLVSSLATDAVRGVGKMGKGAVKIFSSALQRGGAGAANGTRTNSIGTEPATDRSVTTMSSTKSNRP